MILVTESEASKQNCIWILQNMVWFQNIWKKAFVALEFYPSHGYMTVPPPFSSVMRLNAKSLQ